MGYGVIIGLKSVKMVVEKSRSLIFFYFEVNDPTICQLGWRPRVKVLPDIYFRKKRIAISQIERGEEGKRER